MLIMLTILTILTMLIDLLDKIMICQVLPDRFRERTDSPAVEWTPTTGPPATPGDPTDPGPLPARPASGLTGK